MLSAYIYRATTAEHPVGRPVIIKDGPPRFLIAPLEQYCDFQVLADNPRRWAVSFFQQTAFETCLHIEFRDAQDERRHMAPILAKAMHVANKSMEAPDSISSYQDGMNEISNFTRNSKTLTVDALRRSTHGRFVVNDRDALTYLSPDQEQFERVVLCQALAVAYSVVLNQCMAQLTEVLKAKRYADLQQLYEQVIQFNASDYFSKAVKQDRHELSAIWDALRHHWHLDEVNKELTSQLTSVAGYLQARRDRDADTRQARRDRQLNYALGIGSLLFTLLSAASLVELTPEHFSAAYDNWVAPL